MLSRLHLSVILLLAAVIWGTMLVVDGVAVSGTWFRPFSTVVGILLLFLVVFDIWAWRLPFLQGWFVPRPDVRGTWRVLLQSDWKEPASGQTIAPILAFLVVRQTFSMISMRMLTAESASELVGAAIAKAEDATYRISGVYRNEPKLAVRERSPIHYGALLLDVEGSPVERLAGHYWTDRSTRGQIVSTARKSEIFGNFDGASRAFGGGGPAGDASGKTAGATQKGAGEASE
ncbi:MAG: hypothetical protein WCG85_09920 [Polyangia bacterium]